MRVLLPFATAALFLLAALGCGRRLLGREAGVSPASAVGLAGALGMAVLSLIAFLAGVLGVLRSAPVLAALVVLLVLGASGLRLAVADLGRLRCEHLPRTLWERLGWLWAGAMLLLAVVGALAPPRYNDAVLYHLPLATRFARAGGLVHVPVVEMSMAAYPLGVELLFGAALPLGGDTVPALLELGSGVFLLLLLLGEASEAAGRGAGRAVAAAFLAAPTTAFLLQAANVDFTFILVAAATLPLLQRGRTTLAGIAAGAAAGMKPLLGMVPLAIGFLFLLAGYVRRRRPIRLAGLAGFAVPGLLAASLWPLFRWATTGNPLYPLFWGGHDVPQVVLERLRPLLRRIPGWSPLELGLGNGPLLLFLLPLLLTRRVRRAAPAAVGACALFIAAAFYVYARDRFLLLAYAQAPGAFAHAWAGLEASGRGLRRAARAFLLIAAGWSLLWSAKQSASNFPYAVGRESREHFVERWFPDYAFVRETNRLAGSQAVVLRLCRQDVRNYYSDYATIDLPALAFERGRVFETAASFRALIASHGVTHVVDCGNLGSLLIDREEELRLRDDLELQARSGRFTLYRVRGLR